MSAMDDTERKNKNNAAYGGTVDDLQRVVRARKYRFCAAEYSQLAEGATNMPEVRNRYLKIAQYYRERRRRRRGFRGQRNPRSRNARAGAGSTALTHAAECVAIELVHLPLILSSSCAGLDPRIHAD